MAESFPGEVRNGVVVLTGEHRLPEGTLVQVQPVGGPVPACAGTAEAMQQCEVRWAGDLDELDRLLTAVQDARDADLTAP